MKVNNLIPVKCTETSFYRMWFDFLAPFHRLTKREREVAARILAQEFKLRESIEDPVVRNEILWSKTSRKDMRESLKMSPEFFQMNINKLKQAEVLFEDNRINPKYIPNKGEEPRFIMGVWYDWSTPDNPVNVQK